MPNHVSNLLTFNVNEERFEELCDRLLEGGRFTFEKFIPQPLWVYRGDWSSSLESLFGNKNWYEWRRVNWGTKWDAYESAIRYDCDEGEGRIAFLTAWNAPFPVITSVANVLVDMGWHEVVMTHWFADEGLGFWGKILWRDGYVLRVPGRDVTEFRDFDILVEVIDKLDDWSVKSLLEWPPAGFEETVWFAALKACFDKQCDNNYLDKEDFDEE